MSAYDAGKSFLAGVLARLPESQRAQAQAIFEAPEAKDALTTLGDGTLARSDYSRQQDALAEKQRQFDALYEQNQTWYQKNEAALREYTLIKPEYDAIKATGGVRPPTPAPATPAFGETDARKIAEDLVNQAAVDAIGISAWTSTKAVEHYQMFGEVLPTQELLNAAMTARRAGQQDVTLDTVYQAKYGDRLKEKAAAAEQARFEQEVQKRLAEERGKHGALPFPTRTEASPLDTLGQAPTPGQFGVDAAVAEYYRLQAAKAGA